MQKQVMIKAWEIAKEGVKKFGGKVKEYFAEALKLAWTIVKNEIGAVGKIGVITKEWTTTKGSKVVFEYQTAKEEIYTDLFEQEKTRIVKGLFPVKLTVNGNEFDTRNLTRTYGKHELDLGVIEVNGRNAKVTIEMPKNISEEIFGPLFKKAKAENKSKNICPNCGEYCWGDCTAH